MSSFSLPVFIKQSSVYVFYANTLIFDRGADVLILNTGFGNEEEQKRIKELLHIGTPTSDGSGLFETYILSHAYNKTDMIWLWKMSL